MLEKLKTFFFGRYVSEEEQEGLRKLRKRAKMYMFCAGAGSAVKADEDGIVRVEEIHVDDVDVSDDHDVIGQG